MTARRDFVVFLAACVGAQPFAGAQPASRLPRVALVDPAVSPADMRDPETANELAQAFLERLRQLGYVEGRSIAIERRSGEGPLPQRLADVMKELVDLRVDVIVTFGQGAIEARNATKTIPIVALVDDPLGAGLTASLSRPTQNVTGVTLTSGLPMIGKRLQLLKQAAPRSRRVAVIDYKYVDADTTPGTHRRRLAAAAAARELGLHLIPAGLDGADDFAQAFALVERERADSMLVMSTPVNHMHRRRIIDFAARRRLPAMYGSRTCVEEGGLMSYGSGPGAAERLAEYVDRILRGARPADLPFEEPASYELAINAKTATLLELTVPESLLLQAEVVK